MFKPGVAPTLPKPQAITAGQHIYFEENVFCTTLGRPFFRGVRQNVVKVLEPSIAGFLKVEVLQSEGFLPFPKGVVLDRPIVNLKNGFECSSYMDGKILKAGGYLAGSENGKKVAMDSAGKGGIGIGASHAEGGIQGEVGTDAKKIEFEGNEIILTKNVATNGKKYSFQGKELTGREVASIINQDNGGVSFEKGGQACPCSQ